MKFVITPFSITTNSASILSHLLSDFVIYSSVSSSYSLNQYSTPSTILNLSLKNDINIYATVTDKWLDDKVFIVDSMTVDWEKNLSEIKLIEKK